MYYGIYQLLSWIFFIVCFPFFFLYSLVSGKYLEGLGQRFGFLPRAVLQGEWPVRVWVHAASVGEVQLARALLPELQNVLPAAGFFLSVMTARGMEMARRQLGPEIRCFYAPFDLAGIVGRVLRLVRPTIYICLETELWPLILRQAGSQGVQLVLLNGRLSARSFTRYLLVRRLMRQILADFSAIAVISAADADRYIALGADPGKVFVLGNAKYDLAVASFPAAGQQNYRQWLNPAGDVPLLVAGSTHSGEEALLLSVVNELRKDARLQRLVLVVAPRHLRRLPEVEALLAGQSGGFERLSRIKGRGRSRDVVLVDEIGELAALYGVATYVFCGGSLVPRGGHNIMEAAVHDKPVFYGPSMEDFADAARLLESVQAGFAVAGPEELASLIRYFVEHQEEYRAAGRRAGAIARAQQGSARRQAALVGVLPPQ